MLSRPHVPGDDWHNTARRVGGAEDCTSTFVDRSDLTPRHPPKPRDDCSRLRILKPRSHDDDLPARARGHSERMDANVCRHLSTRTIQSQHRRLIVAWRPGRRHERRPWAAAACSGVEWRATADEDGHYCFAVALCSHGPEHAPIDRTPTAFDLSP